MKIVWTILIGMLIFQSIFVTFGVFFYTEDMTRVEGIEEISSETEGYEDITLSKPSGLWGMMTSTAGNIAIAGLTATLLIVAILAKNYIAAGIAIYIGFVSWLSLQTAGILERMNAIGGGSSVGLAFIGLFFIVLAILVAKSIIEMLAPGGID